MSPSLRKVVSLIVLVGLLLLGTRFVGLFGAGPVPVEIHYLLGTPPVAVALEVDFRRTPTEPPIATFETRLVQPDVVETTRLPGGPVDLDITLVGPGGARRTVARTIEAQRGAVIRIDLSREAI